MEDSIFTKIIKDELPSWKVYEDEKALAILDIYPVNKGHVLVIPKEAYANVYELPEELCAHLMSVAKRVAEGVKEATGAGGVNIIMNNEVAAGQLITDHAHIHVIPRFLNDGLTNWPSQDSYKEGEKEAIAEKIRNTISG